jgi:hypothetical protein
MLPLQVTEAYVKHQIRMDEVPELVREGARQYADRQARNGIDYRMEDRTQEMMRASLQGVHMWELRILLDYYATTKQHRELQKLYEATKDHGDVVVNVDKELGKVAPYITPSLSYWRRTWWTRSSHRWGYRETGWSMPKENSNGSNLDMALTNAGKQ